MGTRPDQRAKNEALLREVNERRLAIDRQAEESWADPSELFEFVCECGAEACEERIEMTLDEYDAVRQEEDRFAVVPGHESPDIEAVVETHERYVVVDKKPDFERFVEDRLQGRDQLQDGRSDPPGLLGHRLGLLSCPENSGRK